MASPSLPGRSFKQEPAIQRRRIVFGLGVSGPAFVAGWSILLSTVAPWWVVIASATLLTGLYGVGLLALATLAPAETKRKSGPPFRPRVVDRSEEIVKEALADEVAFHRLYFLLRLQDEVRASRRAGSPLTVVTLKVVGSPERQARALPERIAADVAYVLSLQSQAVDVPSVIGPMEYGLFMRETDRQAAALFTGALLGALGDYLWDCGFAVYPRDGTDARELLSAARAQYALKPAMEEVAPDLAPPVSFSDAFRERRRRRIG